MKCEMPLTLAFSSRLPRRSQTPIDTERTSGMVSVNNHRPLGSRSLRIIEADHWTGKQARPTFLGAKKGVSIARRNGLPRRVRDHNKNIFKIIY